MKSDRKTLLLTLAFAVAMGILEAIVVVYLRKIFNSNGFKFPLQVNPGPIIKIEILREFCTLVMLVSVALIAGKNKLQAFSYFIFCFAVWDITYYAGLKLIINWPPSLLTWDILFLIPFPWIGPVLAPIIASMSMILLSLVILFLSNKNEVFKVRVIEWLLIYIGAVLIFISFIWDYAKIVISKHLFNIILSPSQNGLKKLSVENFPRYFVWPVFLIGVLSIFFSMYLMIRKYIREKI